MKKVICISCDNNLTLYKWYIIATPDRGQFMCVKDDTGQFNLYTRHIFKTIDEWRDYQIDIILEK